MNVGRISIRKSLVPTVAVVLLSLGLLALPATSSAGPFEVQLTPAVHGFGKQTVGTGGTAVPFTLRNISFDSPIKIQQIRTTATDFTIVNRSSCEEVLEPKESSCTIEVSFTPQSASAKSAKLIVEYSGVGGKEEEEEEGELTEKVESELTGEGVAPGPEAKVTPTKANFGEQIVGTTSGVEKFTLANVSPSVSLEIRKIESLSKEFSIVENNCTFGQILKPKEECTLFVSFAPASLGPKAAVLFVGYLGGSIPVELAGDGI